MAKYILVFLWGVFCGVYPEAGIMLTIIGTIILAFILVMTLTCPYAERGGTTWRIQQIFKNSSCPKWLDQTLKRWENHDG